MARPGTGPLRIPRVPFCLAKIIGLRLEHGIQGVLNAFPNNFRNVLPQFSFVDLNDRGFLFPGIPATFHGVAPLIGLGSFVTKTLTDSMGHFHLLKKFIEWEQK